MKFKFSLLCFLFLGAVSMAFTQNSDFGKVLSSKRIIDLFTYKDAATFLIYDGGDLGVLNHSDESVHFFNKYNSPLIPSNHLKDIVVTSDSVIYLATEDKGLFRIKDDKLESVDGFSETLGNSMFLDLSPEDHVWYSPTGLNTIYELSETDTIAYDTGDTNNVLKPKVFFHDDDVWVHNNRHIYNLKSGSVMVNPYYYLDVDTSGNIWRSGANLQMVKDDSVILEYDVENRYRDLYINRNNEVILYDQYDYDRLDVEGDSIVSGLSYNVADYDSLIINNLSDRFFVADGQYILETPNGNYEFETEASFMFDGVWAMEEDTDTNLWLSNNIYYSTDANYIVKLHQNQANYYDSVDTLELRRPVYKIHELNNAVIFRDLRGRQYSYFNGNFSQDLIIPNLSIHETLKDNGNGSYWATTNKGLYRFTDSDTVIYNTGNSGLPSNDLEHIAQDRNGNLWLSTSSELIVFATNEQLTIYTEDNFGFPVDQLREMLSDAEGNIWFLSSSVLTVWDGNEFITYNLSELVGEDYSPREMVIDNNDMLWLGNYSASGLSRFDGSSLTFITTENSDIPSNNIAKLHASKNGRIYFYSENALYYYESPKVSNEPNLSIKVYHDANENQIKDSSELLLSYSKVHIQGDLIDKYIFANNNGVVNTNLPLGEYIVAHVDTDKWRVSGDTLLISVSEGVAQYDLGLLSYSTVDARISISGDFPRCNRIVEHTLDLFNKSITPINANLKLWTNTDVFSGLLPPDMTSGDTLIWNLTDIPYGHYKLDADIEMPGFEEDFVAIVIAEILNDQGGIDTVIADTLRPEVRCAYDPNDKTPSPFGRGDERYNLIAQPIDYLIRFQNTGNDTAFTVVVTDTLSDLLNHDSFEILSFSHAMTTVRTGNILEFHFDDILLPDSTTDLQGSNGYVKFRIYPKEDVAESSVLHNKANIYFDFNPPIITNETFNTLVTEYPEIITETTKKSFDSGITVYPNPVKSYIQVTSKSPVISCSVLSMDGKIITSFEGGYLNAIQLQSGMYLINIQTENGVEVKRFVVK